MEIQMKRDAWINVLLIIAGIVLAIALFGAGVVWKGKSSGRIVSSSFGDQSSRVIHSFAPSWNHFLGAMRF